MALDPGPRRSKSIRRKGIGDSARDKARIPVQAEARAVMDEVIQHGTRGSEALARINERGLSDPEKRDLTSYSRARSKRATDKSFRDTWGLLDEVVAATTGVKPSDAWWSYTHPVDRVMGRGRAAEEARGAPAMAFFPFGRAGKAAESVVEKARPAAADDVLDVLPAARVKRREQEKLYTQERRQRAARADEAMKLGGEEGYRAALAELKGELPKLKFGALEQFDQQAADQLFTHIQQHPAFRPFEKISAQAALRKVLDGQVPTRSEIRLLEKAFGPDVATQITESVTYWQKAKNVGLSVINIPRSLMASVDLSAPFRQGLVLGARHPKMFAREFGPMLKAFKSERAYENVMAEIGDRATFPVMQKAKLALTDLEGLSTREDAFMSNYAEILTGGKRVSPVRMSSRAYTAFLNKFRADAFDNYLRMAEQQGLNIDDPHLLRSIATLVNTATGRGSIKGLEASMPTLTAAFFSPRLIASRLQFFNPGRYSRLDPLGANMHPFARAQNRRAAAQLLGSIGMTLTLAKLAGADVVQDPRNTDFGKIKVGDTRVDISGGHQTYVVNAYRLLKGETVSSTTGELTRLEGGFAKPSRADILAQFGRNKLAPVPQYGAGWLTNENFAGDEFDPLTEAGKSLLPIGGLSTYEAYQQGGPSLAALTAGLSGIGFGVLTYGPEETGSGRRERGSRSLRRDRSRSKSLRRN